MNGYKHETIMSNDRYELVKETYRGYDPIYGKHFGREKTVYHLIDKEYEDWLGSFKELKKAREAFVSM